MTITYFGNCFMLRYTQPFSADFEVHSLLLGFHQDLIYDVFFHDPNFFLLTNNLKAIPQVRIRKANISQTDRQFDFYPLVVTERRNLNRPEKPCVEDPAYDF